MLWLWIAIGAGVFLGLVFLHDVLQRKRPILRIYPIVGHLRYLISAIGPELRQYIVASNDEERPFSRDDRHWIYTSADQQNNYFGFGTDNDIENAGSYLLIKHAAFPLDEPRNDPNYTINCAKVMGEAHGREHAFRPESVVYISGMSYGSLGATAVEAMNRGCALAGALHNTGEGGVSPHHQHGGGLIWQIGTGYFGCRNDDGSFSLDKLTATAARTKVKAIEIKLSQGAKPGLGGMLPGKKVTRTIAQIRGIPEGKDCISPSHHTAFNSVDSMIDFIETIAEATGLPVGIKSAVGEEAFWHDLADAMQMRSQGPDFIAIDGGEGGTGAAPLVFADHVALPFRAGFPRVFSAFRKRGIDEQIIFCGSGKLGFPQKATLAMAMGCDMIGVAREAMLSIGCIQAQQCHSGKCPAGIATHSWWRTRAITPSNAEKCQHYLVALRKEMLRLAHACGLDHPAKMSLDHFEILAPAATLGPVDSAAP